MSDLLYIALGQKVRWDSGICVARARRGALRELQHARTGGNYTAATVRADTRYGTDAQLGRSGHKLSAACKAASLPAGGTSLKLAAVAPISASSAST